MEVTGGRKLRFLEGGYVFGGNILAGN